MIDFRFKKKIRLSYNNFYSYIRNVNAIFNYIIHEVLFTIFIHFDLDKYNIYKIPV